NSSTAQRSTLSTPANLLATGITTTTTNCIPFINISALPTTTVCSGTALSLVSFTSNANPTSFLWTAGSGVSIGNPSAASTTATFNTVGTVTVNCVASTSSGSNNQTIVVTVLSGVTEVTSANSESFETATLPNFWSIISPTNPIYKWDITNLSGSNGVQSMFVQAENFPANAEAILESPLYDFLNNPGAVYTFKYAYARYDANNKDLFKVQASKDCGGTWSDIWVPTNSALANGSGGTSSTLFTPSAATWVLYDLTAHPNFVNFTNIQNVLIRFYFKEDVGGTGNGNRMFLDEINFDTPNGINEVTRSIGLNVFPNPTSSAFNIKFDLSNDAKVSYKLTSVTGAIISDVPTKDLSIGSHEIRINENNKLAQGIYFLNFEMNGIKMTKKIIIN
ncbi:MAG: T9SS type A sorting domain-containing protein, partial [Bacteroidetes bacterium]|nr:T9SS type A sorting domain-containing protein [Bacteroidota bacterium]